MTEGGGAALGRSRLTRKVKKQIFIGFAIMGLPPLVCVGALIGWVALIVLWIAPPVCDEAVVSGTSVKNSRGDVVSEHLKLCSALGTNAEYSIVLGISGRKELIPLVYYDGDNAPDPRVRWDNDNMLVLQFRKDQSVWSRLSHIADIHIDYDFSASAPQPTTPLGRFK